MRNFTVVAQILVAGIMVLGIAQGQDPPAAKTSTAPAKTQAAPAAKTTKPAGTKAAPATASKGAGVTALKTSKEKFSYALGMNLGTSLHKQGVEVDPAIVAQGLRVALAGGKTLLTPAEAQAAMMEVQKGLQQKQQEKMQVTGEANKKEGDAFLTANKTKEGVVTLPSGLQYKILKAGAGPKPT